MTIPNFKPYKDAFWNLNRVPTEQEALDLKSTLNELASMSLEGSARELITRENVGIDSRVQAAKSRIEGLFDKLDRTVDNLRPLIEATYDASSPKKPEQESVNIEARKRLQELADLTLHISKKLHDKVDLLKANIVHRQMQGINTPLPSLKKSKNSMTEGATPTIRAAYRRAQAALPVERYQKPLPAPPPTPVNVSGYKYIKQIPQKAPDMALKACQDEIAKLLAPTPEESAVPVHVPVEPQPSAVYLAGIPVDSDEDEPSTAVAAPLTAAEEPPTTTGEPAAAAAVPPSDDQTQPNPAIAAIETAETLEQLEKSIDALDPKDASPSQKQDFLAEVRRKYRREKAEADEKIQQLNLIKDTLPVAEYLQRLKHIQDALKREFDFIKASAGNLHFS